MSNHLVAYALTLSGQTCIALNATGSALGDSHSSKASLVAPQALETPTAPQGLQTRRHNVIL